LYAHLTHQCTEGSLAFLQR